MLRRKFFKWLPVLPVAVWAEPPRKEWVPWSKSQMDSYQEILAIAQKDKADAESSLSSDLSKLGTLEDSFRDLYQNKLNYALKSIERVEGAIAAGGKWVEKG